MTKSKVFMIMPFEDSFFEVYEMLKREFEENFIFSHSGDINNQQNILKDIFQPIYDADIIIADLSGMNPNVLYELGVAHSFNKKVIIITRDALDTLPFDLKQYRAKDYSTHFVKFESLLEHLRMCMMGAVDGTMEFSNPISDFLAINGLEKPRHKEEAYPLPVVAEEKGYFDIISEIETSSAELVATLNGITDELAAMSQNIGKSTESINNSKQNGTASASFAQVQSKIVAGHIDRFSKVLRTGNKEMSEKWAAIERGVTELLKSDIVERTDQVESLRKYLISLLSTRNAMIKTNSSVVGMKDSLTSLLGFEKTLNQAAHFLEHDLDEYVEVTSQMISSIDRIVKQSRLVVGAIEPIAIDVN